MAGNKRPWLLGHRGVPYRENTARGLDECLAAGLDGAEIDVQLLADGTVVVFHDLDLRRLANDPRAIASLRAGELASVRVFGEPIPTLAEILDRWPSDRWLNVELKAGGRALVDATLEQLERRERIVISSFDPTMLEAARARGCEHELALLLEARSPAWLHVDGGRSFGCRSVHLDATLVSPATIERYAKLGLGVGFWGARSLEIERRLAQLGVVRVITDHIVRAPA